MGKMAVSRSTLAEAEREHIFQALCEAGGVVSGPNGAIAKLGMSRAAFYRRMQKLGISRQDRLEAASLGSEDNSAKESRMLRAVTRKVSVRRTVSSSIYATVEYIAKHVFHGNENMVSYAYLVAEDGDDRFRVFIEAWEKDRSSGLPPAAHSTLSTLVSEAGISSIDFCIEVMRACMRRNIDISNMYAGLAHPKVVQRNIKEALKSKGVRDREIFFQHTGWLPTPKGSIFNIHAQANAGAVASSKTESIQLPDFEESTIEGSKIVRDETTE